MVTVNNTKSKTTINLDTTIKKLAQMHAINNEMTLGEVIECALKLLLVTKA